MTSLLALLTLASLPGSAGDWQINENHCLIWGGQPYLPVGARIEGVPEKIDAAAAEGIQDVIVELPASGIGWKDALDDLEKHHMRYLIAIGSAAAMAKGAIVEPASYRVDGITAPKTLDIKLPGVESALVVLATKLDGETESSMRAPVVDGVLHLEINPLNSLEHVALIYPVAQSLEQPGYWDELDRWRDRLLSALKAAPPGPGLRGVLNPLGTMLNLREIQTAFVPSSPYFRLELSAYLEAKYHSVVTAQKVWALSISDVDSFDAMARLVPLWSGSRGVGQCWDPTTDKLYACDRRRSQAWRDIQAVINLASERRFGRLIALLKEATGVPILQDWAGWSTVYEGDSPLDGVGVQTDSDSPSRIADQCARGISSALRLRHKSWALATNVDVPEVADLPGLLDDLSSMGARGWFIRAGSLEQLKKIAELSRRSDRLSLANSPCKALYFPESANNPAQAQRLTGGYWWLPTPEAGGRLDFGPDFSAYRLNDASGTTTVVWLNRGEAARVTFLAADPKKLKFQTLDGSDPHLKVTKVGAEVDMTQSPIVISGVDEIPVPEPSLTASDAMYAALAQRAALLHRDLTEDTYLYNDARNSLPRNPGASMIAMRSAVRRATLAVSRYVWLEAEQSRDTNFSESIISPGCSGGGALIVHTSLDDQTFHADYDFNIRSTQDQEVWLAAKIPASQIDSVRIAIGGQILGTKEKGIAPYANGYAWYKFGVTRLVSARERLSIQVNASANTEIGIDAIVITPDPFRPNGVLVPDAAVPADPRDKRKRK